MDFGIEQKDLYSMLMSVLCGGIIGFEREYKNKSAGFRTIVLITLGSTIFTIVSGHGSNTDDRIAANIITGIGFIGAGVIFKDRFTVWGLTTAAVIWTSAAIGMTTGIGYHALAFLFTILTLIILLLVSKIERLIGNLQKYKMLTVTFRNADFRQIKMLEDKLTTNHVQMEQIHVSKDQDMLTVIWQISAKKQYLMTLNEILANTEEIISFK
ncbi:MgtC/SapB family protein [Dyadobacter sediminis]|uniref:MgtC/SapB family protein n=1 Tax=Dyadobacter sediminis TaxID=1493691 RepID=A0A5R9KKB9_9BACT|nr:MgtC/SapB family protein [Dyadobacter sediminis]TLU96645.1 MgtC/SapB family protein [Dyadobacter sediminis]GGB83997.1 magnesium transporter MgtC [Dyadobacter sediminis]